MGAFFLLSSFFFSHPDSCLKIKMSVGKIDVSGDREEEEGENEKKNGKMKKIFKN